MSDFVVCRRETIHRMRTHFRGANFVQLQEWYEVQTSSITVPNLVGLGIRAPLGEKTECFVFCPSRWITH